MYVQVRDTMDEERFIEEVHLEPAIASGEVVAFRRSDGWINVPEESHRGKVSTPYGAYLGQERRRSVLSRTKMFPAPEGNS